MVAAQAQGMDVRCEAEVALCLIPLMEWLLLTGSDTVAIDHLLFLVLILNPSCWRDLSSHFHPILFCATAHCHVKSSFSS